MKECNPCPFGLRTLVASLTLTLTFAFEGHADPSPLYIEAESIASKFSKVMSDPDASDSIYITANPEKFIPLVHLKIPADFEYVTIWARLFGTPQVLRTDIENEAKDLKWQHRVTDTWAWYNFGSYSRADLGDSIRFVRAPGPNGGIDAIFLDPTGSIDPASETNLKSYEARP